MLIIMLLTCCLNAPLEVTVNTDTLTAGAILPLGPSDTRAAVELGHAPSPGLARRITRREIIAKMEEAGLRVEDLELPDSILVHRRAEPLDPQLVKQAVLDAFARQFPGAAIELIAVDTPATQVGTSSVTVSATLPSRFDPAQPVFVRLDLRSGGTSRTVFTRCVVRIETIRPVLRAHVAANSELKPGDIEWKPAELESIGQIPVSLDALQGMLAKRDLEPGQVLTMDLLYMPLYVRKGESVTVKATSGRVTVSATMRAMAAGRFGETIPVQHLAASGGTTARIVGPRMLEAISR